MRKTRNIFVSVFILLVFVLSSFTTPQKQIDKVVNKLWKGQQVIMTEIVLPDSLAVNFALINKISVDNIHVGYACYTTAFGCRIGGCAAPTKPNSDSYETFDYIIVYDLNLSILKIDIADYPGAYGYEICRSKWLKQFNGQTDGFKLNENIDGISGATVSASYLVDDVNAVGKTVKEMRARAML
jgi:hypothetical protein